MKEWSSCQVQLLSWPGNETMTHSKSLSSFPMARRHSSCHASSVAANVPDESSSALLYSAKALVVQMEAQERGRNRGSAGHLYDPYGRAPSPVLEWACSSPGLHWPHL